MTDEIIVYTKQPGCMYRKKTIPNTLEALQAEVGGFIEPVTIHGATKAIVVICDDEGRLKGYEPNCRIAGVDFVGPIVVCGAEGEEFTDFPFSIGLLTNITTDAGEAF